MPQLDGRDNELVGVQNCYRRPVRIIRAVETGDPRRLILNKDMLVLIACVLLLSRSNVNGIEKQVQCGMFSINNKLTCCI